jgi:hypothetical protein
MISDTFIFHGSSYSDRVPIHEASENCIFSSICIDWNVFNSTFINESVFKKNYSVPSRESLATDCSKFQKKILKQKSITGLKGIGTNNCGWGKTDFTFFLLPYRAA